MPNFTINPNNVSVTDDEGVTATVESTSPFYQVACAAAMSADWTGYRDIYIASRAAEEAEDEAEEELGVIFVGSLGEMITVIRDLMNDETITPEDLGLSIPATEHGAHHEHDLSQWSGSPIFYPTREMAKEQADRWSMFWEYHDFGIAAPAGYRYATVPRLGMAPTAPDGYDWVCLPREE